MRQMPTEDKYTIAWFKLAEFVSRGEKERALGIYKLLILSIDDPAFALKLEGDILYSFKDEMAFEKYQKAANLYQKEGKLIEAAAVYENLSYLKPESTEYLDILIDIYKKLDLKTKIIVNLKKLFLLKIKSNKINESIEILNEIENLQDTNIQDLYENISFTLINLKQEKQLIMKYVQKTIDAYFFQNDRNALQKFLSKLEVLDKLIYDEITSKIKE